MTVPSKTLFQDIKHLLHNAQNHAVRTVNTTMVHTYYEIGRLIVEHEQKGQEKANYGKGTLKQLSDALTQEFGKGFSIRNIETMRKFYLTYRKTQTPSAKLELSTLKSTSFTLSWSHYVFLMRLPEHERCFYDFVDLVFYNRLLKCFVLIDLKIGKLKHQDLGQIQMYVNYYDRFVKTDDENPTIGIVLSKDKKDSLVEITLPKDNKQIFTSQYQTYLPTKAEFMAQIDEVAVAK